MQVRHHRIVIIGSGFAGLAMGIRLKQAGIDNFVILEQGASLGGTWRDNHYPGAACDVESLLYSFSFEPNPRWTRTFAQQSEILAYMQHCAEKHGLLPHLQCSTTVTGAAWDEARATWEVKTREHGTIRANVVVSGCGGLSRPSIPDIPGLETFEGKTFHSARWDHAYPLEGKTVGVVGTGASAIQIVPEIASKVKGLHLFQRTPPWILPKPDRPFTDTERALFRHVPFAQTLARTGTYWKLEVRALAFVVFPQEMKAAQKIGIRYLKSRVKDPVLREKLTPKYTMGCKRILMSNDYFESLQRPNVEVVTDGIARVTRAGVETNDGRGRPLDALILATGFQAAEACAPFEVKGRGGRDLETVWRDGAEAYLGTTVAGFPNLFLIVGPNTGLGHNSMILMIESQVAYIVDCMKTMDRRRLAAVEVHESAQRAYNRRLHQRLAKTIWAIGGCVSWYTTRSGKNTTLWPGFTFEYRLRTRRFDPEAYDVVPDSAVRGAHARASRSAPSPDSVLIPPT
jgi:cation diffusion facilitator CzcD-associated flavoprotein CzcO